MNKELPTDIFTDDCDGYYENKTTVFKELLDNIGREIRKQELDAKVEPIIQMLENCSTLEFTPSNATIRTAYEVMSRNPENYVKILEELVKSLASQGDAYFKMILELQKYSVNPIGRV